MTRAFEWNGPIGDIWAAEWQRTDRSFAGLAPHLNAAILDAAPAGAATIVDIGCGAGATSLAIATALPTAKVTGIDLSPGLIEVARERGAALPNLEFECAPVENAVAGRAPIDLFVSRHGVMFFADPVAGFSALRQAAAPDARLIFSCFRAMALNVWATEIMTAVTGQPAPLADGYAPGPFAFADPAFVTGTLAAAGWREVSHDPVDFTYVAGEGEDPVADALSFFRRIGPTAPLLRDAADEERQGMTDRVIATLDRHRSGGRVAFPAAAWLWSATA